MKLPLISDRFSIYARILLALLGGMMLLHAFLNPHCVLWPLQGFWLAQLALLLLFLPAFNGDLFRFLLLVFFGSIAVEFIAQDTAKLYGALRYGETLGFRVKGVPLLIAVQALLLNWCALDIAGRTRANVYVQALLGAALVAGIWALMEPLSAYGLWEWESGAATLKRYLACFVIAFFFQLAGQSMNFEKRHSLALAAYATQVLLFAILALTKP